jgi:hypothetical protein
MFPGDIYGVREAGGAFCCAAVGCQAFGGPNTVRHWPAANWESCSQPFILAVRAVDRTPLGRWRAAALQWVPPR